jgi:hypothetical protein
MWIKYNDRQLGYGTEEFNIFSQNIRRYLPEFYEKIADVIFLIGLFFLSIISVITAFEVI